MWALTNNMKRMCVRHTSAPYCPAITPSFHRLVLLGSELTAPIVHKQSKLLTVHFGEAQLKTNGLLSLLSPLFDCMEESPFGLLWTSHFKLNNRLILKQKWKVSPCCIFRANSHNPASGRDLVYSSHQINILGQRTGDEAGQKCQDNLMLKGEVSKSVCGLGSAKICRPPRSYHTACSSWKPC